MLRIITYWIRGGLLNSDFTIELLGGEYLSSALKIKVKESWPPFKDVSVHDLRVYKISFKHDSELQEILGSVEEGDPLFLRSVRWTMHSVIFHFLRMH